MKRQLFIFLFFVQVTGSWAQSLSPVSVGYELRANSEIKQKGSFRFTIPVSVSGKNTIVLSPQYSYLGLSDSFPFDATDFHQAALQFAWMHQLDERWQTAFLLIPALSSDFKNIQASDMTWTSGVRFSFTRNPRTSYSFGLVYAYCFSNHLIIPMIGLDRQISDKLSFTANLPFNGRLTYVFNPANPAVESGFFYTGDRWVSGISGNPGYDYLWLQEQRFGLFANAKMIKTWWLGVEMGYDAKCDLKAYEEPDHDHWQFGPKLKNTGSTPSHEYSKDGFLMKITISYRFAQ